MDLASERNDSKIAGVLIKNGFDYSGYNFNLLLKSFATVAQKRFELFTLLEEIVSNQNLTITDVLSTPISSHTDPKTDDPFYGVAIAKTKKINTKFGDFIGADGDLKKLGLQVYLFKVAHTGQSIMLLLSDANEVDSNNFSDLRFRDAIAVGRISEIESLRSIGIRRLGISVKTNNHLHDEKEVIDLYLSEEGKEFSDIFAFNDENIHHSDSKKSNFNDSSNEKSSSYEASNKLKDPYAILEISQDATQSEIKVAYIKLIRLYHPDRVSILGPDLIKLAEEKAKLINWAYGELKGVA